MTTKENINLVPLKTAIRASIALPDDPDFTNYLKVYGLTAEEASEILGTPLTEE